MARSKQKTTRLFVEVLQNGEVIDSYKGPIEGHRPIKISGTSRTKLSVPQYPFSKVETIIRPGKSGRAVLNIPIGWEGYYTSSGFMQDADGLHSAPIQCEIMTDDFGALMYRDIKVLYKVKTGKTEQTHKVKKSSAYRGSILKLMYKSKAELKILTASLVASLFLWGCFVGGLLLRPDDLPETYSDLEPEYILPFLSGDHLENIPEAMQGSLDRTDYIKSTLDYYTSYTQMLTGAEAERPEFLFENSMARYQSLFDDQENHKKQLQTEQVLLDEKVENTKGVASMRIPSVAGSPITETVNRVVGTMNDLHVALTQNLKARRNIKHVFTSESIYDMSKHGNIKPSSQKPRFGDISISGNEDDETVMYKSSALLARQARASKAFVNSRKSSHEIPLDKLTSSISMPHNITYASFVPQKSFPVVNEKLRDLVAAEFNPRNKKKVKEPLTGVLDPALVSKTIDRRKFELQLCYELALRRNQKTLGKMEFSWRIDSRGKISELTLLNSTIRDRRMISCVKQKISAWRFPRPRQGSIKIKYPFSFKPRRG